MTRLIFIKGCDLMGIYQFKARRYDVGTSRYIDSIARVWGFAVCPYQPFPERRQSVTKPDRYIEHAGANVMAGVVEARDVYGKASNGIRFCLTNDINNNFFIFHAGNVFPGGFRYNNVDYTICGGAGNSYYKRAVFSSDQVSEGVGTGTVYENNNGRFVIYASDAFTTESADAFRQLVNLNPEREETQFETGVCQFYAKRYDVANSNYLDSEPKIYSFAVCDYPSWAAAGSSVERVDKSYLNYWDITNVFNNITDSLPSNTNEVRFCLTDSTTNNYFYFYRRAPRDGGFVYKSINCQNIFGSSGSLRNHNKSAVLSSKEILPTTQTGTFWQVTSPYQGYCLSCENVFGALACEYFKALIQLAPVTTIDPFTGGGTNSSSGGNGNYDNTTAPIPIPAAPTISTSETGFITMFSPSKQQLRDLASYMWANPLFDINGWKKIFSDPMQAILGLSVVPVNIPTSGNATVTVGNISTGVTMPLVTNQYVSVDCGSVQIKEYWGAYLDYDPYTKIEIYLPYCGVHALSADDVVGKTITVSYNVDILSGACCAFIKCADTVLYSFIGQCTSSIPITGDNWTNAINGVLSAAVSVGSMVASGGASAPLAMAGAASTAINTIKPSIERSGAMGGTGGLLAYQKPYLIFTRPRQALPQNQNKYTGYPSYITTQLNVIKGYTEVESIRLTGINATSEEIDEIEKLLKEGVIF